jgi:hypothetical protein
VNYQIRIRGRLGRTMRTAFPDLHAQTQGVDTLLGGALADQAALHGVLARICRPSPPYSRWYWPPTTR